MTEHKRCPFCGHKAIGIYDGDPVEYVSCSNGMCVVSTYMISETEWNNRPIEDGLHERIVSLQKELDLIKGRQEEVRSYHTSIKCKE